MPGLAVGRIKPTGSVVASASGGDSRANSPTVSSTLPPLRQELELSPGPPAEDGSPTWTLLDPVRNRFFRFGWSEFQLLARWHLGEADKIIAEVNGNTTLQIGPAEVERIKLFLSGHFLLMPQGEEVITGLWGRFAGLRRLQKNRWPDRLLFARFPLFDPDRFLVATLPFLQFFFSRFFPPLLAIAALFSLWVLFNQWDTFIHTLPDFFTVPGAILFATGFLAAKLAHEFSHAYVAKYHGLRVPTMGVAFLIFWPVFYTDTTDSWRLSKRRQRMAIAGAGVAAELVMAVLATFVWSLVAAGPLKSVCFVLATVSWVITLTVNLNPLVHFDGYYLLSDALGLPNLQQRAFGVGRWRIRRWILGLNMPSPEGSSPPGGRLTILTLYAFGAWVYRLFLFTTISLMVYHFVFKLLGWFLLVGGIGWFIVRPVVGEILSWRQEAGAIRINFINTFWILALLALLAWLIFPWPTRVRAPAVLESEVTARIHAPFPARIQSLQAAYGEVVKKGQPLLTLDSPDLQDEETKSALRVRYLEAELSRSRKQKKLAQKRQVTAGRLAKARRELSGHRQQKARLSITAPVAGTVRWLDRALRPGLWVDENRLLALLTDPAQPTVLAYLEEINLNRAGVGQAARFFPENPRLPAIDLQVSTIDPAAIRALDSPLLATAFGGEVTTLSEESLETREARYRIRLTPVDPGITVTEAIRGVVIISGRRESLLLGYWQELVALWVRESGM
ncbi:MAG: efflux RND transporter periplasmic adaptor subunit [Magnetococcales bacterium]|nr:efflux RND transporter periplasmic adaptor subunit [Magnetococcales bacterium]